MGRVRLLLLGILAELFQGLAEHLKIIETLLSRGFCVHVSRLVGSDDEVDPI